MATGLQLWAFLLSATLLQPMHALAEEYMCPADSVKMPQKAIGSSGAFALAISNSSANWIYSAAAGLPQTYCCKSGEISSWTVSEGKFGYVGQISAICNDGSVLPPVTLGFNGTGKPDCPNTIKSSNTILNPANGVFVYSSGAIMDSFLKGSNSFTCGKNSVPVGFKASSSCLAVTNFQVICGPGKTAAEKVCPRSVERAPTLPIGSTGSFSLIKNDKKTGNKTSIQSGLAGPQQTTCCQSGGVKQWRVAKSQYSGFVGSLSALCTDDTQLPAITLGFNGTDQPQCNTILSEPVHVADPRDSKYTFKSGLILDSFMNGSHNNDIITCGQGLQAIGFSASSSCLALTNFQVLCGKKPLTLLGFSYEGKEPIILVVILIAGLISLGAVTKGIFMLYVWRSKRTNGFSKLQSAQSLNGGLGSWQKFKNTEPGVVEINERSALP